MLNDFKALPVDERMMWAILLALGVGLALGIFMQRASKERLPVRGGFPAQLFHYLASAGISAVIPVIVIALVGKLPLLRIVLSALIINAVTWLCLLIYAVFEGQVEYVEETAIELD